MITTLLLYTFTQPARRSFVAYVGTGGPDADGPYNMTTDNSTVFVFKSTDVQGQLLQVGKEVISGAPKWISLSSNNHLIVTANTATEARLQSFLSEDDGNLKKISDPVSALGVNCVYHSEIPNYIAAVSYSSGTVSLLPYDTVTGSLKKASFSVKHKGHGPSPTRQTSPHPHMIYPSLKNKSILYSPDLGLDKIFQYEVRDGKLIEIASPAKEIPYSGPRHFTQSLLFEKIYVVNEINSTIGIYNMTGEQIGPLIGTISTLPDTFKGFNKAAEIILFNDEYLYVSNRGNNSIVSYKLDKFGFPYLMGFTPSGGWTRSMSLSPDKLVLFALNQNENTITSFSLDQTTGALRETKFITSVPSPVTITWKVLN